MTPKEKREAADKVLDDTMTVSAAKKRKLELRDKDLKIRAASLERKKKNDADAKARRAKASEDKAKKEKDARSDKKASEVISSIRKRKERKAAAEKKKLDNIKSIADKRKAGVKKSTDRAKEMASKAKSYNTKIEKDEGEASAETKFAKDAAKSGAALGRSALNLGKAAAKGVGAAVAGAKAKRAQGKADAEERKIEKRTEKIDSARDKKVKDRLNRRKASKLSKLNPFKKKSEDKKEEPKKDSPTKSAAKEAPKKEEPKKEAPKKEAPKKEVPKKEEPKGDTKSAAKKPAEPEVQKVKVKVEEPKKESGSKRRALKAAAGKAKDLAKKAAANPEVRKAAKAGIKFAAKRAAGKVAPTRKALPSGQKALPPTGGVNKPKTQSKPAEGGGKMSDADRARKDPEFRKKLIQQRNKGMNEEFYQYLLEIERMEKKTDKVIDIMKGKNKIEISPKISEEVTGGILIQDAEGYTPLEIETVDVITPEPLNELLGTAAKMAGKAIVKSGAKNAAKRKVTRAGIKLAGKRGGRAAQAGMKAGSRQAAKAGETKNDKTKGTGEKVGGVVGDVAGSLIGGAAGMGVGSLATGVAGGLAGEKIGSAIGKKFDKKKEKKSVKEEASDAMKDRRMERGGVGGNIDYSRPPAAPNLAGKKKPKKDGPSAMDIVKSQIRSKYGDKAIMDTKKTKKEGYSDWRSDLLVEAPTKVPLKDTGNPIQNTWNKFVPPPESSNNPNVRSGVRKPGRLEAPLLKKANDTAAAINAPIKAAGQATKGLRQAGSWMAQNPLKTAAIGAGVVGAGLLAKKVLGGDKKKEQQEHSAWRSELNYVEEGEGKKDACYHKVKASAKVWPSAYASGRLVQCRKKGAANYGNSKKD